jgi:prepilin-type N-terminal cleavage/methylation domain-containing protein
MNKHVAGRLKNSGFSMIEILMVLAGAAIIAAIAVPLLSQMSNSYESIFAGQEIGTQLHFAKLKAISSNETMRVHFPNANTYQVELSDGTVLRGPYFLPRNITINTATDGNGVTFPGRYVAFQPDGTLPAAGNGSAGRIRLIAGNGLHVDVVVERGGQIRQTPPYENGTAPF